MVLKPPQTCQPCLWDYVTVALQPVGRCKLHVGSLKRDVAYVEGIQVMKTLRPEDAEAGLRAGSESAEPKSLTSLQVSQRKCKVLHSYAIPHPTNQPIDQSD